MRRRGGDPNGTTRSRTEGSNAFISMLGCHSLIIVHTKSFQGRCSNVNIPPRTNGAVFLSRKYTKRLPRSFFFDQPEFNACLNSTTAVPAKTVSLNRVRPSVSRKGFARLGGIVFEKRLQRYKRNTGSSRLSFLEAVSRVLRSCLRNGWCVRTPNPFFEKSRL